MSIENGYVERVDVIHALLKTADKYNNPKGQSFFNAGCHVCAALIFNGFQRADFYEKHCNKCVLNAHLRHKGIKGCVNRKGYAKLETEVEELPQWAGEITADTPGPYMSDRADTLEEIAGLLEQMTDLRFDSIVYGEGQWPNEIIELTQV